MGNAVEVAEPVRSVLMDMATRHGMDHKAFEATLRATVFPGTGSKEQFTAYLMVAKEYNLNPILKEIYAFPAKGGGIQPVVSIDGWMNLINSRPEFDGLEFDDHVNDRGDVTAITARIWRKDRQRPVVVTEYLAECQQGTEPWKKWPRRMLRHKAAIQCARYAFGFSGIADPDEAERMGTDVAPMKNITPPAPPPAPTLVKPTPPAPPAPPTPTVIEGTANPPTNDVPPKPTHPDYSRQPEEFLAFIDKRAGAAKDIDALNEIWVTYVESLDQKNVDIFPSDRTELGEIYGKHQNRIEAEA